MTYFVNLRLLNDHLFGKELFIRFTASAFRKLPSIYVLSYFLFGFEGRMPYCYLFLLSIFILWFSYFISDVFCKFKVAE